MRKTYLYQLIFCLIIGVLSGSEEAKAQLSGRAVGKYLASRESGKKMKSYLRYELGYSVALGNGFFVVDSRYRNPIDNSKRQYLFSKNFGFRGMSINAATHFPITNITERSILTLGFGAIANVFSWELGNMTADTLVLGSSPASGFQIGIPVGLEYKAGGEATLDKADKVSITLGAGICPTFHAAHIDNGDINQSKFNIQPYLKAELGFFAGIEWKIKAMYLMKSTKVIDYSTGDPNLNSTIQYSNSQFKTGSIFTVGLAIMPFSWDWDKSGW